MDRAPEDYDATVDGRAARWAHRRPELVAALVLAGLSGLYLDLVATGDVDRVDTAFEQAMTTLSPALTLSK